MFIKLIDIILDAIGDARQNKAGYRPVEGGDASYSNIFRKKETDEKPHPTFLRGLDYLAMVFRYMNERTRMVNSDERYGHLGIKRVIIGVRAYCSRPQMIAAFIVVPGLYLISPMAVVVVPALIVAGAFALIIQSFLPIYIGLDFSLMGAVLGSILFGPVAGVVIVFLTYVLAMKMPSGHQDALEYERIVLFSFLAMIIPFIPVGDIMLKAVIATYIGELMEMLWHKLGEGYPWSIAFLKVFPRSIIYIYVFHKVLVFLV